MNTPKLHHKSVSIANANISKHAIKTITLLNQQGFEAYLVGGCVRDLLLNQKPKDFDVVTNATPEQIRSTFPRSRVIGRRFRIVHVYFPDEIIEVSTFRANASTSNKHRSLNARGMIMRDNVYGTLEEDAWRRDFTINALYYDINKQSVIDYTSGIEDLEKGVLRIIGKPEHRYVEDPVRMLRAVRFSKKLELKMHPETESAIIKLSRLLADISAARLFQECVKLFHCGSSHAVIQQLIKYKLFPLLFPQAEPYLIKRHFRHFLNSALLNTDKRVHEGKPVTPAFLFAVLLWPCLQEQLLKQQKKGVMSWLHTRAVSEKIIKKQHKIVNIPHRYSHAIMEMWHLQGPLEIRKSNRIFQLMNNRRFRAAYDFLLLRSTVDESLVNTVDWWTQIQEACPEEQEAMITSLPKHKQKPNE